MICQRCHHNIKKGEERVFQGQTLCEDCYIDALSPVKACDPWAVYNAKSFLKENGSGIELTETQAKILKLLKETGGLEPKTILEKLPITPSELEREIASLRHMEKVRAENREGKKIIVSWQQDSGSR